MGRSEGAYCAVQHTHRHSQTLHHARQQCERRKEAKEMAMIVVKLNALDTTKYDWNEWRWTQTTSIYFSFLLLHLPHLLISLLLRLVFSCLSVSCVHNIHIDEKMQYPTEANVKNEEKYLCDVGRERCACVCLYVYVFSYTISAVFLLFFLNIFIPYEVNWIFLYLLSCIT